MTATLSERTRSLLDARSFAVLASVQPDGSPQQSVVWVKRDGDDVLVSTLEGRRKHLNMVRDPRVTLLVNPPDAPYTYSEVRGTAAMTTEGGGELIQELSHKYQGTDYTHDGPDDVRVVVRIRPTRVVEHG